LRSEAHCTTTGSNRSHRPALPSANHPVGPLLNIETIPRTKKCEIGDSQFFRLNGVRRGISNPMLEATSKAKPKRNTACSTGTPAVARTKAGGSVPCASFLCSGQTERKFYGPLGAHTTGCPFELRPPPEPSCFDWGARLVQWGPFFSRRGWFPVVSPIPTLEACGPREGAPRCSRHSDKYRDSSFYLPATYAPGGGDRPILLGGGHFFRPWAVFPFLPPPARALDLLSKASGPCLCCRGFDPGPRPRRFIASE